MGVLSRHFITRFLSAFAAALLILVLSILIVEMLADLDAVFGAETGVGGAIARIALRIPARDLPFLVPVGAFTASFVCFGNAARSLEIVATKAGGVSPLRLALPVFGMGAVLAVCSLALNETISVRARDTLARLERGGAQGLTFRQGFFWYRHGRFLYRVEAADPGTGTLRGVTIYERDARGRLARRVVAERAEISAADHWRLMDARSERFDPAHPAAPTNIAVADEMVLVLGSQQALLEADLRVLSIGNLLEYRAQRRPSAPDAVRASALIHERMVNPLSTFCFVVLAAALGLRVERSRSLARSALYGLIALFLFFAARRYGALLGSEGVLRPSLPAWSIFGAFALFALDQLRRVPR